MPKDDLFDEDAFTGSEGMANLRKAYDKAITRIKELEGTVQQYESQTRAQKIEKALADLGADPKYAALVPSSLELDGLAEWAKEFGFIKSQPDEGKDEGDQFFSDEERQNLTRLDGAAKGAASGGSPQDLAAAIANAKSLDELQEVLLRQS